VPRSGHPPPSKCRPGRRALKPNGAASPKTATDGICNRPWGDMASSSRTTPPGRLQSWVRWQRAISAGQRVVGVGQYGAREELLRTGRGLVAMTTARHRVRTLRDNAPIGRSAHGPAAIVARTFARYIRNSFFSAYPSRIVPTSSLATFRKRKVRSAHGKER
jgi:hypothetical protein